MSNPDTTFPGSNSPKEGSWFIYKEGKTLNAGGGANTTASSSGDGTTGTSSTLAYTVDVRSGSPVVTSTASMAFARQFANAVVLPNGEVMVIGGDTFRGQINHTQSTFSPPNIKP